MKTVLLMLAWIVPTAARAHAGRDSLFGIHVGDALNGALSRMQSGNGAAFWTAMFFAFLYGIVHTIGPGHGKLVVASYFASGKARYARGALMGLQIAFFHVLSSVALVVSVNEAAKFAFGMDEGLRYISIIGYGAVSAVGAFMFANAVRGNGFACCACGCGGHGRGEARGGTAQWLLAMGIGAIPCPGILAFLFYAMSNRMLWTGICAVMSVAIGMAAALCAVGMASIFANRKIGRDGPQGAKHSKAAAALRLASSLAIMVFGLVLLADSI